MAVRVCGVASRSGAGKVIRGGPGPVGDLEGEEPGMVEVTTLKGGTWGSSSRRETLLGQTVAVRERRVVRANGEAAGGVELGRDPQEDSFWCWRHRSPGGNSLGTSE